MYMYLPSGFVWRRQQVLFKGMQDAGNETCHPVRKGLSLKQAFGGQKN